MLPLKFGTRSKKLEWWLILLKERPTRQVLTEVNSDGDSSKLKSDLRGNRRDGVLREIMRTYLRGTLEAIL